MNIPQLAADIASRIPEMARDCVTNNEALIQKMICESIETELHNAFFCDCPHQYSLEEDHPGATLYFGRCHHRHGLNLGRIPEPDLGGLRALVYLANKAATLIDQQTTNT